MQNSDDLDETLFDIGEPKSTSTTDKQHTSSQGASKRRNWLRKHAIHSSFDEDEQSRRGSAHGLMASGENSRRESVCSAAGGQSSSSPSRAAAASPKKTRDNNKKDDEVHKRSRRDSKHESPESRLSAGARLYRVLEEQVLGSNEPSEEKFIMGGGERPISLTCNSTVLTTTNTWYSTH